MDRSISDTTHICLLERNIRSSPSKRHIFGLICYNALSHCACRGYLEEYWKWPYLEFAKRGEQVEALLGEVGRRFYHALFGSGAAQKIVQAWQQQVNVQHQISIVSEIACILRLPWELLSDLHEFLVLHPDHPISVVRRLPKGQQTPLLASFQFPLRILLVTARPEGAGFVDSRSISRALVDELQMQSEAGNIELEFLRPPTLKALRDRLQDTEQPPIHVFHFDGHGGIGGKKQQGILLFETEAGNESDVEASDLAKVLKDSGVRLAVLTACQSAVDTREDALSSVSTQLISNGVDAVIAMSSSILVTSAARYVEAFYHAIAEGLPVSIAHEQARQELQKDPYRHPFHRRQDEEATRVKLYDWWVPHFYQQSPALFQLVPSNSVNRQPLQLSPVRLLNKEMPAEPHYGFSGRAHELQQIERHLLQGKIVALHGFGGIGKTALAREAADWLTRTRMYDGACFVSFEHMGDAAWLLGELGRYLDIYDGNYNPSDKVSTLARLKPVLEKQRLLVIADNLESILLTREVPLGQAGRNTLWETLIALQEIGAGILLTTRDTAISIGRFIHGRHVASLHLQGLQPEDAYTFASGLLIALGIDRSHAPYAKLRDLLVQLDHHPLAIQLVLPALQKPNLDIETIRTDLASLLSHFTDNDEAGRNHSLLASLDYSLRRLSLAERDLLSRLAVFEGGADEYALVTITEISVSDWVPLRLHLEQTALLTAEYIKIQDIHHVFLRFHPMLTPFLRNQSDTDGATLWERYALYYAEASVYFYSLDHQHPHEARVLVRQELPNIRRALAVLLEIGNLKAASELAAYIAHFLTTFGLLRERDEIWKHIDAIRPQQPEVLTQEAYLRETVLGEHETERGDLRAAFARFTSLLARIEEQPQGTPLGYGSYDHSMTLARLARCLKEGGHPAEAEKYLRRALAFIEVLIKQDPEDMQPKRMYGTLLGNLADLLRNKGKYTQARETYEQALKVAKQLGDLRGQIHTLEQLGTLSVVQHDPAEAKVRYLAALQIIQKLNEPPSEARAWFHLGMAAEEQQDWAEAERCYRESLSINERLSAATPLVWTYHRLAGIARRTERPAEAEGWYRHALELNMLANQDNPNLLSDFAIFLVSEIQAGHTSTIHLAEAKHFAEQALAIEETRDTSSQIWNALGTLAIISEMKGQAEKAQGYYRRERETYAAFEGNRYDIDLLHGRLIASIAAVAQGDTWLEKVINVGLPELEREGWTITDAIRRIWAGERDWHDLVEGMRREPALLILRVLETIAAQEKASMQSTPEEIVASLPASIREAMRQGNWTLLTKTVKSLTPEKQQPVMDALLRLLNLDKDGDLKLLQKLAGDDEQEHGE